MKTLTWYWRRRFATAGLTHCTCVRRAGLDWRTRNNWHLRLTGTLLSYLQCGGVRRMAWRLPNKRPRPLWHYCYGAKTYWTTASSDAGVSSEPFCDDVHAQLFFL